MNVKVGIAILSAVATFGGCNVAQASIYYVTGTNLAGDTLTGTIDANAGLTTISSINLLVSGLPNPPVGIALTSIQSYAAPLLEAVNFGPDALPNPLPIYLSFAGGPTLADVTNLMKTEHDAAVNALTSQLDQLIATNFSGVNTPAIAATEADIASANAAYEASFAATAVAAVPEPSTSALMIFGFLGLGWMAYRKKGAPRLA